MTYKPGSSKSHHLKVESSNLIVIARRFIKLKIKIESLCAVAISSFGSWILMPYLNNEQIASSPWDLCTERRLIRLFAMTYKTGAAAISSIGGWILMLRFSNEQIASSPWDFSTERRLIRLFAMTYKTGSSQWRTKRAPRQFENKIKDIAQFH